MRRNRLMGFECKNDLIDLITNHCPTCSMRRECQIKDVIEHALKHSP